MDEPLPIDQPFLDMASKVVASAISTQISGQIAINNPNAVATLLRTVALELVSLRRGQYALPQKK